MAVSQAQQADFGRYFYRLAIPKEPDERRNLIEFLKKGSNYKESLTLLMLHWFLFDSNNRPTPPIIDKPFNL